MIPCMFRILMHALKNHHYIKIIKLFKYPSRVSTWKNSIPQQQFALQTNKYSYCDWFVLEIRVFGVASYNRCLSLAYTLFIF